MESKPQDIPVLTNSERYREKLTVLQWKVAFEDGTEPPFNNLYYNNKEEGIYKSIASEVPLFSSKHKFDSDTGWPSFYQAVEGAPIKLSTDYDLGYARTEVKCSTDSVHLGHVFSDGP